MDEYAGEYEGYQRRLSVENAEAYLEERAEYEKKIEKYECLIQDILSVLDVDNEYYKNKPYEERVKEVEEMIKYYA